MDNSAPNGALHSAFQNSNSSKKSEKFFDFNQEASSLKRNWKDDLVSGLLVSLIALPLCLGIAMASGFPPFGGILTAIIGGLIVGPICGSQLSIKGPAAGLIAIAIAAVESLGEGSLIHGYRYTLAIVVAAGIIQMIFALLKFGRFTDFFPSSAIHGMLAAIGIIIISKQVHPMLGVSPKSKNPIALLFEIPKSIMNLNPEVASIGLLSLAILIIAPKILGKHAKKIPAQLLAVIVAIPLGLFFDLSHEHIYSWYHHSYHVGPKELVNIPSSFVEGITFPDFSKFFTTESFKFLIMFALIGSLESMLTVKAVDGLDPEKRKSNSNKDLLAVGFGNSLCGLLGGLPMISEVVRSYANINNGAKSRWANFFHGAALLIFIVLLSKIIHLIPIASLSAILCITGFRLAAPKHFGEVKEIGLDQLLVFCVTIVGTLATDLLVGVGLGILTEFAICFFHVPSISLFLKNKIKINELSDSEVEIVLPKVCYFGNILNFNKALSNIGSKKKIKFNFSESKLIDHTFMKKISEFSDEQLTLDKNLVFAELDKLRPKTEHSHSLRKL